jgi:alkanesulfonate monooxygenase SsuD/methylene tetrahydromethanopterin reductase-like flavin-dependent oxidoreductase (luciferase family)
MDEHGYYGVGFTEHHFHIEGEEVSTNPVMLDLYFGMQTKRMKFGQLGNVLPSHNPVNLAENIAMVVADDQGRVFAGFARGYQPRWVNVLGQQVGLGRAFGEESYEELKRIAVRRELRDHHEVPGRRTPSASRASTGRSRPQDIKWAAARGHPRTTARAATRTVTSNRDRHRAADLQQAACPTVHAVRDVRAFDSLGHGARHRAGHHHDPSRRRQRAVPRRQEAANKAGKNYKFGQGMAMSREVIVADTDAEAEAIAREAGSFIWNNFFVPFGFNAAVAGPAKAPFDRAGNFETMSERGLVIYGSPTPSTASSKTC